MLRVAGSLHTGTVAGDDLLRMFGRDGHPTTLGAALADYGRAAKTLHLLAMRDPDDETYRRMSSGYSTGSLTCSARILSPLNIAR